MTALDCAGIGPHHSEDRVELYHGRATPALVCGYHAQRLMDTPALFRLLPAR